MASYYLSVNVRTAFGLAFGLMLMIQGIVLYFSGYFDAARFVLIVAAIVTLANFMMRIVGLRPTSSYEKPFHVHLKP